MPETAEQNNLVMIPRIHFVHKIHKGIQFGIIFWNVISNANKLLCLIKQSGG